MKKIILALTLVALFATTTAFAAETYNPGCLWCETGPNGGSGTTGTTTGGTGASPSPTNPNSGTLSVVTYGANSARSTSMTVSGFFAGGVGTVTPGILYGTNQNNISQLRVAPVQNGASGYFTVTLYGLSPGTLYYLQAVAYSANGTAHGAVKSFPTTGSIVATQSNTNSSTTTSNTSTTSNSDTTTIKEKATNTFNKYVAYDNTAGTQTGNEFLTIETGDTVSCPGDKTTYIIRYKNPSGVAFTNTLLSVAIPAGFSVKSTSAGTYNENSKTVLVQVGTLSPSESGIVYIAGVPTNDALDTGVLTPRADLSYNASGAQKVQTVYAQQSTEGCEKSFDLAGLAFGSGNFFPTSLLGWIIIALIIFAIVYVIRFIARRNKAAAGGGHGH